MPFLFTELFFSSEMVACDFISVNSALLLFSFGSTLFWP